MITKQNLICFFKVLIAQLIGCIVIFLLVEIVFSYLGFRDNFIVFASGWWGSSYAAWIIRKSGVKI